jgi:transcriptional regulator with XRE-family HTH domain
MTELDVKLGELVREYRLRADLTQLELAKKLGYGSVQFVSLFERGLSKIPAKVIGKLVVILGIPEKKIVKHIVSVFEDELNGQISEGKKSVS